MTRTKTPNHRDNGKKSLRLMTYGTYSVGPIFRGASTCFTAEYVQLLSLHLKDTIILLIQQKQNGFRNIFTGVFSVLRLSLPVAAGEGLYCYRVHGTVYFLL